VTKKKTRKTQKFQKAVAGATINEIMAKRNQKPEVRKAQREQAIRLVSPLFKQLQNTIAPCLLLLLSLVTIIVIF